MEAFEGGNNGSNEAGRETDIDVCNARIDSVYVCTTIMRFAAVQCPANTMDDCNAVSNQAKFQVRAPLEPSAR